MGQLSSSLAVSIAIAIAAVELGFIVTQEEPKATYIGLEVASNITMLRS